MKSLGHALRHPRLRLSAAVQHAFPVTTLVVILLTTWSVGASAQSGDWTYQFGYQGGTTSAAYFGTKGVASGLNNPGAREGGVTWTDASGNLWMFGGYGDSSGYIGYLNDIWTWNVTTKQWTWVGGDGGVLPPNYANAGVYGTQGAATATNLPGGRVVAEHWVDSTGKVWMYGGQGADANDTVGDLNDLWRYDPATQEWTWISGPTTIPGTLRANPAVYGTLGVAAAANTPGGRDGATTWIDASGNLWLFGGEAGAVYNDLWMFNTSTGQWTWEGGSQTAGSAGSSGVPGIASATALPAARLGGFGWVDQQHNFWLFGGINQSGSSATADNDLWEYNPASGQWTYWSGSVSSGTTGSYGTLGVPAASNQPAGRAYGSAWTDAKGNLWMFGGTQIALNNNLNDLWLYTPSSNEWTWMGGSSTVQAGGSYGPQGTATATAYPGARDAQLSWVDSSGNFWLFGGWNSEPFDYQTAQATPTYWDDLWEYAVPAIKSPAVTVSPLSLSLRTIAGTQSVPQTVTLTNSGTASVSISGVAASGANAAAYQLTNNCGATLTAEASCTVGVVLNSPSPASLPATLVFTDSDASSPQSVVLNGYTLTATTTSLSGINTLTTDASDTLTVVVTPSSGGGIPTGTVTLQSAGATVATLTLSAAGTATYTINQPPVGSTAYTAIYNGDSNYGGSTSNAFTVKSIANPATSAPAWTWLNGASTLVTAPVPVSARPTDPAGTGVASTSNYPGVRYDSLTWADTSGNLYLFGGLDFDDLWKYNVASGAWTFLNGSFTLGATLPSSVYGTKGTAAAANMPGSRTYSARWTDANGNLWLFGGTGPDANGTFGPLNDLWMYSPATNNWTWMGGDQTLGSNNGQAGVYGTMGVAAAANKPGGRSEAVTWVDKSGNLWLFGGVGIDSTGTQNPLNDLWMYSVTTNEWTWVAGSSSGTFNGDVYVAQGLASPGNTPSARQGAMSWVDSSGKLWLFGGGGFGVPATASGELNDLWMFDPSTNLWTYVAGTVTVNSAGSYGTLGTGSTNNVPPARQWGATFTDASGDLWLFGGGQVSFANSTVTVTPFNDLWMYSPTTDLWTWVAGSNTPGSVGTYGTEGMASTANIPSARLVPAFWSDNSGNFWLLGGTNSYPYGSSFAAFDDLWKATPATASTAPAVTLSQTTALTFVTSAGSTSAPQTFTVTNSGTANLTITSIAITNSTSTDGSNSTVFAETNNCGSTLTPGSYCTVSITYSPTTVTDDTAYVAITDNATGSPETVLLQGLGQGAVGTGILISPSSLRFSALAGSTSASQTINISSNGYTNLSINSVSITGANPGYFAQTNNCSTSIAAGGECQIFVTFSPAAAQTYIASVSIADNATGSPQTVGLTGVGSATLLATQTQLSASASSVTVGTSVMFTATVAESSGYSIPSGIVTFYDGSSSLGTGTLFNSGVAYLTTNALTVGPHSITAKYGGDANNAISTSTALSVTVTAAASSSEWTWQGGNEGISLAFGTSPVYGTQGTPSTANLPGNRYGGSTWTDSSGNLWLLGGYGPDSTGTKGYLNDLWEYSPSAKTWTWLSGSNTVGANDGQSGVYGTLGTAAAGNVPGGRQYAAAWTDSSGRFWLFGGFGFGSGSNGSLYGPLNDLWMYNPATNQWTWEGGAINPAAIAYKEVPGVYGTKGVPSTSNIPGGRYNANFATDSHGNFWLYGGEGGDSAGNQALLNDLWMFNPTTGAWTWVGGSSTVPAAATNPGSELPGVYGTKGTAASTNVPGSRLGGAAWMDASGNFWLFGGDGADSVGRSGNLNDLWMFNSATSVWTWMGGSSTVPLSGGTAGVYGTEGSPGAPNIPGSRYLASTWTDTAGNFWLFGGSGNDSTGAGGPLNDLWMYSPSTSQWTWMDGSNLVSQAGSYGTLGVPSASNTPGYRNSAPAWTDKSGNFWLYGGGTALPGSNFPFYYSDLWEYGSPATQTSAPAVTLTPTGPLSFSATSGTTSTPQMVTIQNSGTASLSLTGISITGVNASSFAQTNTCGTSLSAGSSCAVSITFSPNAAGIFTAALSVADNASGSPQTVALNGSGNAASAPAVTLSPATSLSFTTAYGSGGVTQTVTITNSGSATLNLTSITVGGTNASAFSTNTCPTTLAAGASCNLSVSFSAPGIGSYTGTLNIADNATGSPQMIALSGTGTAAPLTATPPGPLSFSTPINTTSAAQSVVITNTGSSAVAIPTIYVSNSSSIAAFRNSPARPALLPAGVFFSETNNCPSSLSAGATCTVSVTFSATTVGSVTNYLLVQDGAAQYNPLIVTLNGTGTQLTTTTAITVSGTSVTLGSNVTLTATVTPASGSAAPTGTVTFYDGSAVLGTGTLSNGIVTLSTSSLAVGPHSLTAGYGGDTNDATSTSTALTVTVNAAAAPSVMLTPAGPLNFTAISGASSAAQSVMVTNSGTATLSSISIMLTGASAGSFAQTTTCGGSLAANGSCSVSVTFTPTSTGNFSAALSIADNATGSPQTVSLSGTGTAIPAPAVTLAPAGPLNFTAVSGSTAAAQTVTVTNSGTASLALSSISLAGVDASAFAQTNNCGASLAIGASCAINVAFTPSSISSLTASLSIADNATGSPQTVALNGTGTSATSPTFTFNVSNPTQTALPGSAATYVITASAQNGTFPGPISLTASGLPSGVIAVFTPPSISPGRGSATSQFMLSVPASFVELRVPRASPPWVYAGVLPMLGLGLAGIRRRRRLTAMLVALAMAGTFALFGCGGGFGQFAPQTYTITITGTAATQTATTTVTLTVQ